MNFLAHLFLSCESEPLIVGNFIADYISNRELKDYSPGVQNGVLLHRSIDSFTDNHPQVRKGTRRLRPFHRKYAPVVVDVFYDYLLSKNWGLYSAQSFGEFRRWVYEVLEKRMAELPAKLRARVPGMIRGDWLRSYSTFEGLQYTFERLDRRSRFPSNFKQAVVHLKNDLKLYDREFQLFFPDVIRYVDQQCRC